MWHVRLLTEDGDVLEEATLASFTDVVDITNRHVDIVNAEVARGRSVTLEITDPVTASELLPRSGESSSM